MLLHAALSDSGPYGQRTRELAGRIHKFLAHPSRRGRIARLPAVTKHIGASGDEMDALKVVLAQSWLQINQDGPEDAKTHYKNMLETELGKLDPDVRILVSKTVEEFPRQAYVTKDRAQTMTTTVTAPLTKEFVKVYERRDGSAQVKASALDEAIARVRDAYITAPVGDIPAVAELIKKLGYVDDKGATLAKAPAGFSEAAVRERQLAEDWRGQRGKHVVRAFDIIPEEVKLIAVMRAVEAHRILFTHLKALSHIYSTYYQTGGMPALDGRGKQLKLRADPSVLASVAETMRRMLEGSGEKVSITLNNTTAAQQAVQAEGAKADVQISQATKNILAKMETMSPDEIRQELANMDFMTQLLADGGVTGAAASSQPAAIDVPAVQVPLAKVPPA